MTITTSRTRNWRAAVIDWWANDLPPVSGVLRAVFYGGLLYFAFTTYSPLTLATMFVEVRPEVRAPVSLFRLLALDNPPLALVTVCRNVCLLSWIFAALGLLTRPAKIVTAATAVFLHGLGMSVVFAHGWFVPVYSLVFMALARGDDTFSLDAVIRRRFPRWQVTAGTSWPILHTGFPRKLVAVIAVSTLFAGGVTKLMESGLQWLDGTSLQSYVLLTPQVYGNSLPRFPWLASLITSSLQVAAAFSVAALLLELASPLALFSRRWRHLILGGAVLFHTAIYMTMLPEFFAQAFCYILLVDWAALRAARPPPLGALIADRRTIVAVAPATVFTILLPVAVMFRVESWPVTHVPMYASYVSDTRVSGVSRADYRTAAGMSLIADLADAHRMPWVSHWLVWLQTDVVLREGAGFVSIKSALDGPQVPFRYSWVHLLREVVLQEFRNRRQDGGAPDVTFDTPGILANIANRAAGRGIAVERYETVELIYRLDEGPFVLARVPVAAMDVSPRRVRQPSPP